VVYLDEILERLAQRDPSHPLLTVFLPYRVSSVEQLTAAAPTAYQRIQASAYPEPTKTALFEVLTAWLGARFPHLSYREVLQMFQIEHTFEESQIYKDLIAIGENRGIAIGENQGITIGESRLVLLQLRRRLGEVPESLEGRIRGLASPQLEALGEALLDFRSRADLEQWLDAQPEADDPTADPAG
jgi:predicted transposase YdaD